MQKPHLCTSQRHLLPGICQLSQRHIHLPFLLPPSLFFLFFDFSLFCCRGHLDFKLFPFLLPLFKKERSGISVSDSQEKPNTPSRTRRSGSGSVVALRPPLPPERRPWKRVARIGKTKKRRRKKRGVIDSAHNSWVSRSSPSLSLVSALSQYGGRCRLTCLALLPRHNGVTLGGVVLR